MEHLIVGCIKDYDWYKIEPWVNSLKQSGYKGHVCILDGSARPNDALEDKLTEEGVMYYRMTIDKPFNFMVSRFAMLYALLLDHKFDDINYIITTDVRDVIFQSDPSELMSDSFYSPILVASEGIAYKDEPWSRRNIQEVLGPPIYERLKHSGIICAGVIGGGRECFEQLCFTIYTMCMGLQQYPKGGGGPDQSVLNYILNTRPWRNGQVQTTSHILHAGTTPDAVMSFSGDIGLEYQNAEDRIAYMKKFDSLYMGYRTELRDGKVWNLTANKPFTILHQYDRVNEWKNLDQQYRKNNNA